MSGFAPVVQEWQLMGWNWVVSSLSSSCASFFLFVLPPFHNVLCYRSPSSCPNYKIWSPLGILFGIGLWFRVIWCNTIFFIALCKLRLQFFYANSNLCWHDGWPWGVRAVAYNCARRCVSCSVACIAHVSGVHSTRTCTPRSRWNRLATCFMSSGQVPFLGGTENDFTASKESVYLL